MAQRREIVERNGAGRRRHLELLGDFTEQLRLLDAVDAQIGFQIRIQFDHVLGIARLLDDKPQEERPQGVHGNGFRRTSGWRWSVRGRRSFPR